MPAWERDLMPEKQLQPPLSLHVNGNAVGLSAPPITALITPEPVRHCRIPDLPLDGSLLFEFMFFTYLLVALFIQYINIYKTVWWYPYNHPASCTSLNFHLIDYHLAAFITVMLARRLVWALISEASQVGAASMVYYTALITARLVLLTLCGWVFCWTLVNLFRNHSVLNLLFLGYPFGVYVPLCCFHQDNRSASLPTDCGYFVQDSLVEHGANDVASFVRPKDFLSLLRESLREQFNSSPSIPTHSCPLSPDLIRNEVECLRADFNRRIKEVLFNSLFSAYYVAFLPLCFVKLVRAHGLATGCSGSTQSQFIQSRGAIQCSGAFRRLSRQVLCKYHKSTHVCVLTCLAACSLPPSRRLLSASVSPPALCLRLAACSLPPSRRLLSASVSPPALCLRLAACSLPPSRRLLSASVSPPALCLRLAACSLPPPRRLLSASASPPALCLRLAACSLPPPRRLLSASASPPALCLRLAACSLPPPRRLLSASASPPALCLRLAACSLPPPRRLLSASASPPALCLRLAACSLPPPRTQFLCATYAVTHHLS
uniref:Transmembrane protein 39A n=1 Tax=Leptobrachium leishanense TaxID=445787 RepID=A0A8C5PHW0_9ANUR